MRDIVFLYLTSGGFIQNNAKKTIVGNVLLRVFNVVDNLKKYHPELNVYCYDLFDFIEKKFYKKHPIDKSILLLNKGCFQTTNQVLNLYKHGYVMVSDYIDDTPELMECFIAHITSSVTQHGYFATNYPNVYYVIHGFDNHFNRDTYQLEQSDQLKMTYCGAADNLHLMLYYDQSTDVEWIDSCTWWKKEYYTDTWQSQLTSEEIDQMMKRQGGKWVEIVSKYLQPQTNTWKDQLKYYNCHIGLRKYDQYAPYKPFTKGFTAAALRSPIVVDSFNVDAKYYLPSDYPLFSPIDGPVNTISKVNDVLNYVKGVYGTPKWDYAVQCMDNLYEKCNPQKIAKRWKTVFQKVEQLL